MSLQTNLTAAFQRVANEAKALRTLVNGNLTDLSTLSTDAKSSLVAAINELHVEVQAAIGGGTTINDGSVSSGAAWSSQKITDELEALKEEILGPEVSDALDTLREIGDLASANEGLIESLTTALANRVRFDEAQGLTAAQQTQARQNIGAQSAAEIGDTTTNFVNIFETALA